MVDAAAKILGIRIKTKKTYYTVYTDSIRDIPNIISFYTDTMKGMKAVEFRIWARSFNKMKKGQARFEYLTRVRDQMRKLRSLRHSVSS